MQVTAGGKVKMQGGGRQASGKGHAVKVTIPIGTVIVSVAGGVGSTNAAPIELTGEITEGEANVEIPS